MTEPHQTVTINAGSTFEQPSGSVGRADVWLKYFERQAQSFGKSALSGFKWPISSGFSFKWNQFGDGKQNRTN